MSWIEHKAKLEERATTFNKATAIRAKARDEKRDMTAEESAEYNRILDATEKLDKQVTDIERELSLAQNSNRRNLGREDVRSSDEDAATKQLRQTAYNAYLRGGIENMSPDIRAALLSTDANSVAVPEENTGKFFEVLKSFGGLRELATIIPTDTGGEIPLPVLDDTGADGEQLVEGSEVDEEDVSIAEKTLGAKIFDSKWIKVSRFMLQDASFPVEAFINKACDVRIQRATNAYYTTRLLATAATGHTQEAASESYLAYDDLVALYTSVDELYRRNGRWSFGDTTLRQIMGMTDTNGNPIWLPAVAGGAPSTVLGKPYSINSDMPTFADGNKPIAFGDFSYLYIRDVREVILERNTSLFAGKLQVGFLKALRTDAALGVAGAVKVMVAA